jgi:hypothetical protein
MKFVPLSLILLATCCAAVSQELPAGTVLPTMVSTSLKAKKDKPGQKIEGRLMQEVPLADGRTLKKGGRLTGKIVSVNSPSRITVRFDQLQDENAAIPLNVSLRALATSSEVFQAGVPIDASSASIGADGWTTKQVGGDVVFRGRGYVSSAEGRTGRWTGAGVWGKLQSAPECLTDDNGREQSLWVFSSSACGTYGFDDEVKITQSGQGNPTGDITIQSNKELAITGGSGWLLLTNPSSTPAASKP